MTYKSNVEWKKKPMTEKQGQLLHDLVCEWMSELNRGQASKLIEIFTSSDENPFTTTGNFDDETQERNR